MLGKEEEINTLKSDFFQWVNQWHDLKLKKDKYKSIKKSLTSTNERLLKQGEQDNIKVMEL